MLLWLDNEVKGMKYYEDQQISLMAHPVATAYAEYIKKNVILRKEEDFLADIMLCGYHIVFAKTVNSL